jgi:formiminotetrahydrofolate cyclodeaminase
MPLVTQLHRRQAGRRENLPAVQLGNTRPPPPPLRVGRRRVGRRAAAGWAAREGVRAVGEAPAGRGEPTNPVCQEHDGDRPFRDYALGEYLEAVAARQPAPSGGGVAAVTVASAAGLVAMVARYSALPGAAEFAAEAAALAAEADALRIQVLADADADAAAYAEVLAAYRAPREDPARADRIRAALAGAAEVPARIAAAGARVAVAGARAAARGNPNLAGDAMTAVLLAEAATRAASELVRINTQLGELDPAPLAAALAHRATAAAACRALSPDDDSD